MKTLMLCGIAASLALAAPSVASDMPAENQSAPEITTSPEGGSAIHWLIHWVRDLLPEDETPIDELRLPGGPPEHGDGESNG